MPRRRWPHCHPKRCLRGSLCRPQLQSRAHIFLRRSRCKRWLPTASISLRNIAPRNSMPPWRRSTAQQCNPCIQMPQLQSRSPLGTRSGRRKPQPPKASLRRTRCSSSLPLRKNICLLCKAHMQMRMLKSMILHHKQNNSSQTIPNTFRQHKSSTWRTTMHPTLKKRFLPGMTYSCLRTMPPQ